MLLSYIFLQRQFKPHNKNSHFNLDQKSVLVLILNIIQQKQIRVNFHAAFPPRSCGGRRCRHCISFRMSGTNSCASLSSSFHSCGMKAPLYDPPAPSRAPSAAPRLQFSPGTQTPGKQTHTSVYSHASGYVRSHWVKVVI